MRIRRARAAVVALCALALVSAATAEPSLEVGVVTAVLPIDGSADEFALPVVIEVRSPAAERENLALSRGEIRLELRDAHGSSLASLHEPFAFAAEGADAGGTLGLRLYAELRLGSGTYTLEATARDFDSSAAGRASAEIRIPAHGTEAWIASSALVVDRRSGWHPLRASQTPASGLPYAFVEPEGGAFLPAAAHEVRVGTRFVAQALVAAPVGDFPFLLAEVVDVRDGRVQRIPATASSVTLSAYPGVLAVALELGPVGSPGEFRLRLGLASPDGGLVSPIGSPLALRVLVAAGADDEPADASGAAQEIALAANADLVSEYRRVLALLADKGVEPALPELVRLELGAWARRSNAGMKQLRDAQRAVVAGLDAHRSSAPRVAAAALQLAATGHYRELREMSVAAASEQLVSELLSPVSRAPETRLRAVAADLLALSRPAEALAIDPDHSLALLRTAIAQERMRLLGEASQTLARLLRSQPEHFEARLRAAVVLRRRGELAAARDELERVIQSSAADWILELAYSEIAGVERRLGHAAEAERWLRQGIERIEAQQLHLQLAFYLDEARQWTLASAVVHRLPVAGLDGRAAARHLYSREPPEETAAARTRVTEAVSAALPALEGALAVAVRGARR